MLLSYFLRPSLTTLSRQTSGGIGGNHELIRKNWPARLGEAPKNMISGVPEHKGGSKSKWL
ncbi:hypothetical protein F9802_02850 [Bacillus aerolatus]|uniref:Uncharacterized protein n=1 Tax=Bacillus aerolatus TaxID=2653354 RepID=A0A6I1FP40_9BACI|nr:hypothetical protein F9802_02850 [Bacillus aerolatus]